MALIPTNPALPVSLTVIFTGMGQQTVPELITTYDLDNVQGDRLLAFIIEKHGLTPEGVGRTPSEIADAFTLAVWANVALQVAAFEREVAARAAVVVIPPMTATLRPPV